MDQNKNDHLDNDDLSFLNKLSAVFGDERERQAVQSAVSQKIAATDFTKVPAMPAVKHTNPTWWIISGIIILAIPVLIYFTQVKTEPDKQQPAKQALQMEQKSLPAQNSLDSALRQKAAADSILLAKQGKDKKKDSKPKLKKKRKQAIAGERPAK